MKTGLTLGKYAPFHKGHQFVIETALAEMDRVIVIIYDSPDVTDVPLPVRADWIRKLYPQAEVVEAWNGPVETGDSPHIHKMHEHYVIDTLGINNIDAFYSSEFYGHHMGKALNAKNRIIDKDRTTVDISASKIRENPYKFRKFLNPAVYYDLITNVAFLGAPGTGKTTIAKHLAEKFNTEWMHEFGRDYWTQNHNQRQLSQEQLVTIAKKHVEQEDSKLADANRYLFTDTNAVTTYIFSHYYHNNALPELAKLANQAETRYDLIFVCGTDIPYEDSWDRSGEVVRELFQKMIIADLQKRKLPFFMLDGELKKRIETVSEIISGFSKYQNIVDLISR